MQVEAAWLVPQELEIRGDGCLGPWHYVAFGPDGHLYVSSYGTDSVLRYNGSTGAFINTFVPSGSGGLSGSGGMKGPGGAPGTGGHDISPVVCGTGMCPLSFQCCVSCDGAHTCAPTCTSPVCCSSHSSGSRRFPTRRVNWPTCYLQPPSSHGSSRA